MPGTNPLATGLWVGPGGPLGELRRPRWWWHTQGFRIVVSATRMQRLSILAAGTAALAVHSTSLARARLCTPQGVQHVPDPPGNSGGSVGSLPTQPLLLLPPLEGKVPSAKEEKADTEGVCDPLSRRRPPHQFHPLPNPHRLCLSFIYIRALGWFLASGPLPPQ